MCTPHTVDETSAYYAAIQFESSRTPRRRAPLRSKNGSFTTWWDEHEVFIVLTSNCLYWNLRPLKTETGNQVHTCCLKCLLDDSCTNVVLQLTGPEFNSKLNVIFQRLKGQYISGARISENNKCKQNKTKKSWKSTFILSLNNWTVNSEPDEMSGVRYNLRNGTIGCMIATVWAGWVDR